jgi:prolyl-tRNA editing enzyme YbaK/EbsC (Cys-tRNA(Pro) deacylase)
MISIIMDQYEEKLKQFMQENGIDAQHINFQQTCHSVDDACKAVDAVPDDFVKSICLIGSCGLIVAIVSGNDRASTERVSKALNSDKPRIAIVEEVLEKTGYPCGSTPPFGYYATFLIDPKVMEKDIVYAGGGSQNSLIKIRAREMQRANQGIVVRVRK